jgi:hypothetical protein
MIQDTADSVGCFLVVVVEVDLHVVVVKVVEEGG